MIIPSGITTNKGYDLADMAGQNPVLLIFLRHFGCIFCRESLYDIGQEQEFFQKRSVSLVFVHMDSNEQAQSYFQKYGLTDAQHVSDPECRLYQHFGLEKGRVSQLFGLKTWIRGFEANMKGVHYQLKKAGDSLQMPGIFVLDKGEVKNSFVHNSIADQPDYIKLLDY